MTVRVEARSDATPERVWELYARPGRWSEWAPHVRSPRGLGEPEVEPGARGSVRLGGALPIPATIGGVEPGREWTWRVGPVELRHTVTAADPGTLIGLELSAPRPLEPAIRITYAPVARLVLANLARVAARSGDAR